ncbi:stage II sporulation protein M [Methanococcoides sp. FTZ1]|uniref:stage II sporulation protein M n=1 Tax=Methanococcoides sp. FTZ1 TaxID=3439061 RepID=UPI003F852070
MDDDRTGDTGMPGDNVMVDIPMEELGIDEGIGPDATEVPVSKEEKRTVCESGICKVRDYLSNLVPEITVVVLMFVLSGIAGYFYTALNPSSSDIALEGLDELVELIMNMTPIEIMLFIFFNNAIKSLLAFVLGLGFGLIPLLFVISNGYILGVVTYLESKENGFTYIFLGIMPHGIIELPMILISAAMGVRMGLNVMNSIAGRYVDIKGDFKQGISVFFRFVMPMLLLAAGIETFITPLVIGLYTGII